MQQVANFLGFSPESIAVVTGAASGIGRETAIQLLGQGLHVIGFDINEAALASLDLGERFTGRMLNVGNQDAVAREFSKVREQFGAIAYLVNNAGPPSSLAVSLEEGVVLTVGSVQSVSAAWEAAGPPDGASLVNVASVAGVIAGGPPPAVVRERASIGNGWYAAGKAAISGLTRYQAVFAAGRFRANAVAPSVIATPRVADLTNGPYGKLLAERCPLGRLGTPADVAGAIVFLLSPAASFINGETLVVDGGGTLVF